MDFFKKIIDMQKTTCYFIFEKMEIILKANLLKGRDAKPRVQGRETKAAGCRIKFRFSDVLWNTEERIRINICGRLI